MRRHARPTPCAWRPAYCLVLLAFAPTAVRAEDAPKLVAGNPMILRHPEINKSIGNPVHCLTFLREGDILATGASSGVLLWDVGSGELRETLEADARAVDALAVDPAGTRLVAGGASGVIKVWDARTLKRIHTLEPTRGSVRGLAISPDGKLLASASPNGQLGKADKEFGVILWDLTTGARLRTLPCPSPAFGMTALAFLPDGKRLVAAQDREIRTLSVDTGEAVHFNEMQDLSRSLEAIALSTDGRRLVTGAFEPTIRRWDTEPWRQSLAWKAHDREPPPRRGVSAIRLSPDDKYVLSGGMDGMVCVWDAVSGRLLLELDGRGETSGRWITGVAMTRDSGWLAASHFGGSATIWRITEQHSK